jgi:hypothetical protein
VSDAATAGSAPRPAEPETRPFDTAGLPGRDRENGTASVGGCCQSGGKVGTTHLPAHQAIQQGGDAVTPGCPPDSEDA